MMVELEAIDENIKNDVDRAMTAEWHVSMCIHTFIIICMGVCVCIYVDTYVYMYVYI